MIKEKTISISGTILVHVILLLILLFFYVKPSDDIANDDELSGVPVMFGNVQDALGNDKPNGDGNGTSVDIEQVNVDLLQPNNLDDKDEQKDAQEIVQPNTIQNNRNDNLSQTQDLEETLPIPNSKKEVENNKSPQEALVKKQQKSTETQAKVKLEEEKKKNINNQLAGLFGDGTGSSSRGNTSGNGTQGSPSGNGDTGKTSGIGGRGSYDLGGRGVGTTGLILPIYDVDDYGTVVVDIIVDPRGNVIEVSIGKGTTTSNATLRSESVKAARKTKFKVISTSNNQRGTITYKFNLN